MVNKINEYDEKGIEFTQVRNLYNWSDEQSDSLFTYFRKHVNYTILFKNISDIYILYKKEGKDILGFILAEPNSKNKFHLIQFIEVIEPERRKGYATDMIDMYFELEEKLLIPENIIDGAAPFWVKWFETTELGDNINDKISIGEFLRGNGYSEKDMIWGNWHKRLSPYLPDEVIDGDLELD